MKLKNNDVFGYLLLLAMGLVLLALPAKEVFAAPEDGDTFPWEVVAQISLNNSQITPGDYLSASISLEPGNKAGQNAEWFLAYSDGTDFYSYTMEGNWVKGDVEPTLTGPLSSVTSFNIPVNTDDFKEGNYGFYFGVFRTADQESTFDYATVSVGAEKAQALIEPETLKNWMDQGLVGSEGTSGEKVVIIDVNAGDELIQGSSDVPVTAELTTTRFEGVADAGMMVATGEMMDDCIQSQGINENTTIVFTNSGLPHTAARAYWTFRYWGFPKNRLKVLNGGTAAFAEAYPELMTEEAYKAERSDYSVRDLDRTRDELRASIGEVIQAFAKLQEENSNTVVIDAIGDAPGSRYQGESTTAGKFGGVVVVDGHPEGGKGLRFTELLNDDNTFKSAAEIEALLEAEGWTPDKELTIYCTSGYFASGVFFALDAILDADKVQMHDGSWSQTGKYSDYAIAGGEIPYGNPWAIDSYLDHATTLYNSTDLDNLKIETLELDVAEEQDDPFTGYDPSSDSDVNPAANDIEEQDMADVGNTPTVTITEPSGSTSTDKALIEPAVLQDWIDNDLVNAPLGQERVVVLDASPGYAEGHIPGAQLWDIGQHVQKRLEGPAPAVNMAVNATRMNQLIQGHSIDENTTIVLTTGAHPIFAHRAYFLFRYYGWPKSRLKVLNGHNGAWDSNDMTTEEPNVEESELTVQDIGNLKPDLRVSLPEFMDALRDQRGRAVDVRGDSSNAGSTSGVYGEGGDYVVFEGRPRNGTFISYKDFMIDFDNGDERFKSVGEIRSALHTKGVYPTSDSSYDSPVYSYCRTGYLASTGFFVLDGILGWDVMLYDGSWSQFGKMSDNADKGGELTNWNWAVDNNIYMGEINYNADATEEIEPLNPVSGALETNPLKNPPNQVEESDSDYIN